MNKYLLILLFLYLPLNLRGQYQFTGEANVLGLYSPGEKLPFWMRHNMRGRVSENTNVSAWITGNLDYELGYYSSLEFGSGILYHDGIDAKVYLDELYAMYTGEWLVVIAGQMQKAELYNGLSSSNENILWSLNAPPLPGIQIRTKDPIFPFANPAIGFEFSWNEYFLGGNRYVSASKLHHKKFIWVYKPNQK